MNLNFFNRNKTDEEGSSKGSNSSLGLMTLLGFIFAKGQVILAAVLKMKGLLSFVSMLGSILVYWWTMKLGLPGALVFVGLLWIHEMGHVIALRHYGIKASAPMFIPFLGAVIGLKELPNSADKEAVFAIAGPILGSIGAAACLGMWFLTGANLWLWGASIGFMLNLFNLIPISPLDGGRIIGAVWRGFWFVGLGVLAALAVMWHSSMLVLFMIIGLSELNNRYAKVPWWIYAVITVICIALAFVWWDIGFAAIALFGVLYGSPAYRQRNDDTGPAVDEKYFALAPKQRLLFGAAYLGLAGILGFALHWVNSLGVF